MIDLNKYRVGIKSEGSIYYTDRRALDPKEEETNIILMIPVSEWEKIKEHRREG